MRQYSSFAGIVFGQKTRKFFANLVRFGFVSTYDCAHNRGRVYHVRHRAIYEAIGEPDSRLRRPPGVPRALERLMLLDAILENPESIWMSSSTEKLGYLASRGISADDAPHLSIRQGDQRRQRIAIIFIFAAPEAVARHDDLASELVAVIARRQLLACVVSDETRNDAEPPFIELAADQAPDPLIRQSDHWARLSWLSRRAFRSVPQR